MTTLHFTQDTEFTPLAIAAYQGTLPEQQLLASRELAMLEMIARAQRDGSPSIDIIDLVNDSRFENESLSIAKQKVDEGLDSLRERGIIVPCSFVMSSNPEVTAEFIKAAAPEQTMAADTSSSSSSSIGENEFVLKDPEWTSKAVGVYLGHTNLMDIVDDELKTLYYIAKYEKHTGITLSMIVEWWSTLANLMPAAAETVALKTIRLLADKNVVSRVNGDDATIYSVSEGFKTYANSPEQTGVEAKQSETTQASVPMLGGRGKEGVVTIDLGNLSFPDVCNRRMLDIEVVFGSIRMPLHELLNQVATFNVRRNYQPQYFSMEDLAGVVAVLNTIFDETAACAEALHQFDRDHIHRRRNRDGYDERPRRYRERDGDRYHDGRDRDRYRSTRDDRRERFSNQAADSRDHWTPEARLMRLESIVEDLMREEGRGSSRHTSAGLSVEERLERLEHLTDHLRIERGNYRRAEPTLQGWPERDFYHSPRRG